MLVKYVSRINALYTRQSTLDSVFRWVCVCAFACVCCCLYCVCYSIFCPWALFRASNWTTPTNTHISYHFGERNFWRIKFTLSHTYTLIRSRTHVERMNMIFPLALYFTRQNDFFLLIGDNAGESLCFSHLLFFVSLCFIFVCMSVFWSIVHLNEPQNFQNIKQSPKKKYFLIQADDLISAEFLYSHNIQCVVVVWNCNKTIDMLDVRKMNKWNRQLQKDTPTIEF